MAEGELASDWPEVASNKPIGCGYFPQNVDQKSDGQVRAVIGKDLAGASDGDAAAAALGEVDVVDTGAGSDDETEGGEVAEEGGGDRSGGVAKEGLDGSRMGVEKIGGRQRRLPGFEETEFLGEASLEMSEDGGRRKN